MEPRISGFLLLAAALCFSMSWIMKRITGRDNGDYQNLGFSFLALGLFAAFRSVG